MERVLPRVRRSCRPRRAHSVRAGSRLLYRHRSIRVTPKVPSGCHSSRTVAIIAPRPPRPLLGVRARLRDVAMWFVTGFDDIVIERTWRALRRGDREVTARTWRDLVVGFPGCAVPLLLALAALVGWLVVHWSR